MLAVTMEQVTQVIGEKELEIKVLRQQIQQLQQRVMELTPKEVPSGTTERAVNPS